jgi:hypothetical protein
MTVPSPTRHPRYRSVKLEHDVYDRLVSLQGAIMTVGTSALPARLVEQIDQHLTSQSPRHKTLALSVVVDLGLKLLEDKMKRGTT